MSRVRCFALLLTLLALSPATRAEDPPEASVDDLERRAQQAEAAQDFEAALKLRMTAVALLRKKPEQSRVLAVMLIRTSSTLSNLGRVAEALPLQKESLAILRRLHSGDHQELAAGVSYLAGSYALLGRAAEALPLQKESLAMMRRLFPGDNPGVAACVNNLAYTLQVLGRTREALPLLEESLAMTRRLHPGDHPDVAGSLGNVASVLRRFGRDVEALQMFKERLAMCRRLYMGDHPDLAAGLSDLALSLTSFGRAAEALPLFEAALTMRQRVYGHNHPHVAKSLNNFGTALQSLGRADKALPLDKEALAIRRRVYRGDHPDLATGLNNLGYTLNNLGRTAEALPYFEESLAMQRRLFPGDHPGVALGMNNLAGMYGSLGRTAESLPLLEETLAMRRRLFPNDHPDRIQSLGNLAETLERLDRAADALPLKEEALAMSRRLFPGDHPDVARSLDNLAGTLAALGRPADALPLLDESLAMSRRLSPGDHPATVLALSSRATTLASLGRMDEALPVCAEAYAMADRLGLPQRWEIGRILARLQLHLGQKAEAIESLNAAVEVLEAIRSDARGLRGEERAQFVASMRERGDPYALLVVAHGALGQQAEAFAALERGRGREMLDTLLRGQVDPVEQARERANAAARKAIDDAVSRRRAAEATVLRIEREMQRARASRAKRARFRALRAEDAKARRALLDALSRLQRLVRDEVPGARPLAAREVQALLAADERLLAYSIAEEGSRVFVVSSESVAAFEIRTPGLEDAAAGYAKALAEEDAGAIDRGGELFDAVMPQAAWDSVRDARRVYLMADGALNLVPFETLVVAAPEGRPVYWVDAGPAIAYVPSASVLSWLLGRARGTGDGADLVAVGDPVFAGHAAPVAWPEKGVLITGVSRGGQAERLGLRPGDVLVAYGGKDVADPSGLRAAIGAARQSKDIAVVFVREGERKEVQAAPGTFGIAIAMEPPAVAGPKLLGGALRSGTVRGRKLTRLPGTRTEVEGIRAAFGAALGKRARVTTLLGNAAREGALFEAAQGPRVLHLATHGLADETETASFSSLALTPPAVPVPGDDGFLTLVDLFSRWRGRLVGTDLVVLSACESTRGRMQKAEGMYALPWGFLYAGSRAVVGSLWKVDDESTAYLMQDFYRRWLKSEGKDPLGALAAARLATKKKYPHPNRWGAFVFAGAPR